MRSFLHLHSYTFVLRTPPPYCPRTFMKNMIQPPKKLTTKSDPNTYSNARKVDKFQRVLRSESSTGSTDGWDKCWEQGLTPWDLGQHTPVLVHLCNSGALPKGRALVPGCGSGYDVMAIASSERYVIGVDISDIAIKKAKELSSGSPNAEHFTFLKTDFFTWHPAELFDLIFDYTFFCAIEPDLRSIWASKIREFLKPDGELITLIYPIDNHEGGPPYKVSIADYEEVLHPVGFKAISIVENQLAIAPRRVGRSIEKPVIYACSSLGYLMLTSGVYTIVLTLVAKALL